LTTLDTILTHLPEDVQILAGYQQTPNTIFLSYSEEDFFKILNHPVADRLLFRFLEAKKPPYYLIHLSFVHSNGIIQLSISVNRRTETFGHQLTKMFPSAAFYLESIQ
jgi:hypothetical protein